MTIRGIRVDIYRTDAYPGARGLAAFDSPYCSAILVGPGVPEIIDVIPLDVVLRLDPRHGVDGPLHPVCYPMDGGQGTHAFGGAFVWSSDSRLRALTGAGAPLPIHDMKVS